MKARSFLAVLILCALSGPGSLEAIVVFEDLAVSVSPEWPTTTEPLIVTVTGLASCPEISDPVFGDGTVDFIFTANCPILPPDPSEFTLFALLEPLPAGIWEIRVIIESLTSPPFVVIDSQTLIVSDYTLEVMPSPATEEDSVTARLTGFGVCPHPVAPVIEPGRIRLGIFQLFGICDPPTPIGPFEIDVSLGQIPPGDYAVEYFLALFPEDVLVAETTLRVHPIGACEASESALCLGGNRFRAEAAWTTSSGELGSGTAVEETQDTGLFWFFNEENIELVVKVLDACDTEFNSFWVFAGGLTDVGVTLTVTDTETGATAIYENPVGRPFETITDTAAFATCP